MAEPMSVTVEDWPVAADDIGIWLTSGTDAWRPRLPVMSDTEPHADVEAELAERQALEDAVLIHSTSWRVDGPRVVLTYVVVLTTDGPVRETWPEALPVSVNMVAAVGKPPTNAANAVPMPRYVDVLLHAVRHIRFLSETDATATSALNANWTRHLQRFAPALAGMYDEAHAA